MACLDTTVLLDLMGRGGRANAAGAGAAVRSVHAAADRLVTTRFNVAELYIGVERSRVRDAELERVRTVLDGLAILEFDEPAARLFASHTAHLQRLGRPAGDMDVLIASTAMAGGHPLITRNARHFADIPGLDVRGY